MKNILNTKYVFNAFAAAVVVHAIRRCGKLNYELMSMLLAAMRPMPSFSDFLNLITSTNCHKCNENSFSRGNSDAMSVNKRRIRKTSGQVQYCFSYDSWRAQLLQNSAKICTAALQGAVFPSKQSATRQEAQRRRPVCGLCAGYSVCGWDVFVQVSCPTWTA